MPKVLIFEPPQSCSSGACSEDDAATEFAAILDSLRAQGVEVVRFNLGYQPEAFAQNPIVKQALSRQGIECLPMTIVDEVILTCGGYPTRDVFEGILGRVPPTTAISGQG